MRAGGSVTASFRRGRLAVVATSAPAHALGGARPGRRLRAGGWRRRGHALRTRRLGRGLTAIAELRRGRVRRVALARTSATRGGGSLHRLLRSVSHGGSTG